MEYPITIAKEGFTLTQPTKDYFIHSLEPMFMWHENSKIVCRSSKDLDSGIVKLEKLSDTMNIFLLRVLMIFMLEMYQSLYCKPFK